MGSSAGKNKKRAYHQSSDTTDSSISSDLKMSDEEQNNKQKSQKRKTQIHQDEDNYELMWDDEVEDVFNSQKLNKLYFIIPDKIELKKICKETQYQVEQTIRRLKELNIFDKVQNSKIKPHIQLSKRNSGRNINITRIRKITNPNKVIINELKPVSQNKLKPVSLSHLKTAELGNQVQRQFNPYKKHRIEILKTTNHKNEQEVNENWIEKQNQALLDIQRKNGQRTLSTRRKNQLSFLNQIKQNKSNQFYLPSIQSVKDKMGIQQFRKFDNLNKNNKLILIKQQQ